MKNTKCVKIIIAILIIILFFLLYLFTYPVKEMIYIKNNLVDNNFFHTVDGLDYNFSEYKNRTTMLEDLSEMNNMLHSTKSFDFIEMRAGYSFCFALKNSYRADESFFDSEREYNYSDELRNIKAVSLSNNAYEVFNIVMEEGNFFDKNDFIYKDDTIPIILGNDYKNHYKLNDTINLVLRGQNKKASIKGFLKPESSIIYFNKELILDKFVLIPAENFDKDYNLEKDFMHSFSTLLDRNNGIVNPIGTKEGIEQELKQMCDKVNLPYALSANIKELHKYNNKSIIILSILLIIDISLIAILFIKLKNYNKSLSETHL